MADAKYHLLADEPITEADEDQFGRVPIADRLIEMLVDMRRQTDTGVVAMVGAWGSGKTSVLNLVENQLPAGEWQSLRFNPWLVSDTSSLVSEFFSAVLSTLPSLARRGERFKAAAGRYIGAVAPLVKQMQPVAGSLAAVAAGLLESDGSTLEDDRKVLQEALHNLDRPLLVLIDDLDRLHPRELLLTFKLVRLAGHLPNVYYLLAFDEHTVLDVIQRSEIAGGNRARAHAYLEKMIQLRFDLPPLHHSDQDQLFDGVLRAVLDTHSVELDDHQRVHLADLYQNHLREALLEPRSVRRLGSHFDAVLALVKGEVDVVDLLAVTFLRLEHPDLYKRVAHHRHDLAGRSTDLLESQEEAISRMQTTVDLVTRVYEEPEQVTIARHLLAHLFPSVDGAIRGQVVAGWEIDEYTRGRRLGSPDYVDRYFLLTIPADDIADQTVARAVEQIAQPDGVRDMVDELAAALQKTPARTLTKLENHTQALAGRAAVRVFSWLITQAPDMPQGTGLLDHLPRTQARSLMGQLLLRSDGAEPEQIVALAAESDERLDELLAATVNVRERLRISGEPELSDWLDRLFQQTNAVVLDRIMADLRQNPATAHKPIMRFTHLVRLEYDRTASDALSEAVELGEVDALDLAALNVPVATSPAGEESLVEFRWGLEALLPLEDIIVLAKGDLDDADDEFPSDLDESDISLENRRVVAAIALRKRRTASAGT